jgi:hypothetical protein
MGETLRRCLLLAAAVCVGSFSALSLSCSTAGDANDSPTPAAARTELRENLNRALSRTPTVVESPSGVDSLRFHGGFQHAIMMREEADGTTTYNCVDTVEAAEQFMFEGKTESEHAH